MRSFACLASRGVSNRLSSYLPCSSSSRHCRNVRFSSSSSSSVSKKPHLYPTLSAKDDTPLVELADKVFVGTYAKPPVVFSHGKGSHLYTNAGQQYLDFTGGIAVNAFGHCDPEWAKVVAEQATKLSHTSNLFHSEASILLARDLVAHSNFDKVFLTNSGTEANEAALKFARRWSRFHFDNARKEKSPIQLDVQMMKQKNGTDGFYKTEVVAFTGGFAGRSLGALSMTHKAKYRQPFEPLIPGVRFSAFNDLEKVENAIGEDTCAVIVEPIQGEAGVVPATDAFLRKLRELCDKHKALLIFDEVQCGLGRTGRLWAHEAYSVKPDIMTVAKPLGGGLPIGACLTTDDVAKTIGVGEHGTTFGGNALIASVARHVIQRLVAPGFLESVKEKGNYMADSLRKIKSDKIKEVRHSGGLFAAMEFTVPVKKLIHDALGQHVLLVNAGDNTLRFCPPLNVAKEDIDRVVKLLKDLIPNMEAGKT